MSKKSIKKSRETFLFSDVSSNNKPLQGMAPTLMPSNILLAVLAYWLARMLTSLKLY